MSKIVFLSLRTQFSNMGDLLINRALLEELTKDTEVNLDIGGVPNWYVDLIIYKLEKKNINLLKSRPFFIKIIKNIFMKNLNISNASLFLFLKPGGYMSTEKKLAGLKRFYQGVWLHFLKLFGFIIIRSPSSQQNSKGVFALIDKFRLSSITYQLVRDSYSKAAIQDMGLNCIESYDLASYYFDFNETHCLFKKGDLSKQPREKITFSFRKPREIGEEEKFTTLIHEILKKNENIGFVSQVFFDDMLNNNLSKTYKSDFTCYDGSVESITQIMDSYNNSKFVFSNRLHVLMLALLAGAIPIAIVGQNDEKIIGYFKQLDLIPNILNIDNFSSFELSNIEKLWSDKYFIEAKRQAQIIRGQIHSCLAT